MTIVQLPFDAGRRILQRQVGRADRRLERLGADDERERLEDLRARTHRRRRAADDGRANMCPTTPAARASAISRCSARQYGIYITTNEFSILGPEFNGARSTRSTRGALRRDAQVPGNPGCADSACRRSRLLAPAGDVADGASWNPDNNGTEYLLSALDFNATTDNRIAVWALTNTKSLDTTPAVTLTAPCVLPARPMGSRRTPSRRRGRCRSARRRRTGGAGCDERRPDEPGRLRRRQALERRQHGHPDVERREHADGPQRDRVLHRHSVDADPYLGGRHDTKQGYLALGNNDSLLFPSIGVNAAGKGVMTFSIDRAPLLPVRLPRT